MRLNEIQIRDPFVLPVPEEDSYYLFGSTDANIWTGPGTGFDCYRSRDLISWSGPIEAFRPPEDFWGRTQYWAPEVHPYDGGWYMFATFKGSGFRGTQILRAESPQGPFAPWSAGPVTPQNWECLDGTLHVDDDGTPWLVFCQEWKQVHDGGIHAVQLSADLRQASGRPRLLFNASEASWSRPLKRAEMAEFPIYVTDGPFLHHAEDGALLMLWSSIGDRGYAMGIAHSPSGSVLGPWLQESSPIWAEDGGHGMVFRALDGQLHLALHQPNDTPNERAVIRPVSEIDSTVRLGMIG